MYSENDKIMKVTPLINTKYLQQTSSSKSQKSTKVSVPCENLGVSNINSQMLNFGAKKINVLDLDFDKKLLGLDGVTCPCCGVKTITKDKMDLFVDKANKVNTAKEFSMVFKEVNQYLKPPYKLLAKYVSSIAEDNPQLPPMSVCKMLASGSNKILKNRFKHEAKWLEKLLDEEDFSKPDVEKLKGCVDYLKNVEHTPKWFECKKDLLNKFGELETPKKWLYYEMVKEKVLEVYDYNGVLQYDAIKDGRLNFHGSVMKKCLRDSVSVIEKYNKSLSDDIRGNKLLICNKCQTNPAKYAQMEASPYFDQRVKMHLDDLSAQIAKNKLEGDTSYIFNVIRTMNKISKEEHHFSSRLISGSAKVKIFPEIRSDYIFEEYEGIPCATCGTIMLPHEQKMKIYNEIIACENLHQLKHLVNMYEAHITPKGKKILNRFNTILKAHPEITEKTLFKKLRKQSGYDVAVDLVTQQINLKKFAKTHEFNSLDQILLVDYMCRLDNIAAKCLAGQEFVYDEYDKAISETLNKMLNPHKKELITMLKQNIKTLYIQDILVRPMPNIIEITGSRAKAMFENIFKLASFTVDHTIARSLGGSEKYMNKLGYCKDCNHEKSGRHFISWAAQHPEMNENLPKQLVKLSEIIRENKLKDYKDYPSEAARYAVLLSRGKLDIPTEYETF